MQSYLPVSRGIANNYVTAVLLAVCVIGFAACRTVVPAPTSAVTGSDSPLPSYSLHNIGPQRVNASRAMELADVNHDGDLDLLIGGRAPRHQGFRIEWGDGKGHWSLEGGPITGIQPRAFAVGDISGDGVNEIVIGGQGDTKGLQVWALDMERHEWRLQSKPEEEGIYNAVRFADINEDGWPDLVAMRLDSEQNGGIYIYLNNGRGGWVREIGPMVEGRFSGLAVADVNGDGHADVIASRRGGMGAARLERRVWRQVGGVQIWYGDGSGRWEQEYLPADGDAESVAVADINGDGHMDIVAGLYQAGIRAWLGAGQRSWDRNTITDRGTWVSLDTGDLENDGAREIVAASADGHGLGVWKWDGGFSEVHGLVPDFGFYSRVALGDVVLLNLHHLDIAALRADGAVEVWSRVRPLQRAMKVFIGPETGKPLTLLFDTGKADLPANAGQRLTNWLASLPGQGRGMRYRIEGHADLRPIHDNVFSDNTALSRARALATTTLLARQGVHRGDMRVNALGDRNPAPPGMTPAALRQNRRAIIRAYEPQHIRLPDVTAVQHARDLFHIRENKVFKTEKGIPQYKVGKGDTLSITLWQGGTPTRYKADVQVDGTISLPFFEALHVDGMTAQEIDDFMTISMARIVRHPRVDVIVLNTRSKTASIFGEIRDLTRQPTGPGTYFLTGKETLAEFLSRVGGPTRKADLTKVQIVRNGGKVVLNLERAIQENDWRENAIIDDGDTIFVPSVAQSKRRVYVLGSVKNPGVVDYTGGISFLDAVSKAGGFDESAYMQDIRIIRQNRDRPLILPIAFNRFMEQGDLTQNPQLVDKDVIVVPAEPIANWNRLLDKLMPTLNTVLQGATAADEVIIVRDILRGASSSAGGGAVVTTP